MPIPSEFRSRWASFGYNRDSWQESLLDFLYFINDPADANTPLPPAGMACIIGQTPVAALSGYQPNDVLFHSSDPDVYFTKKPQEVRVMMQRDTGVFWVWNDSIQKWYAHGKLHQTEEVYLRVEINSTVWSQKRIDLSRACLSIPPFMYLNGCGSLEIDINFWMPDATTITFDTTAGPDSIGNLPVVIGDTLRIRYMAALLPQIGGL